MKEPDNPCYAGLKQLTRAWGKCAGAIALRIAHYDIRA